MAITKIVDRVYLLDTMALGQQGTIAAYVIKGSKPALVDCGHASSYQTVLQGLLEIGVEPSEIEYVIVTHVHPDHSGGAGYLLRHMPKAKVIAHERAAPHLVDPSRLIQSATSIFGEELMKTYGLPIGLDSQRIVAVGSEMHIDLGGLTLTAMHSPGHAPHQISLLIEGEKVLITADAVGVVYPAVPTMIPTTPPPSFNPVNLRDTIDRLGQMDSKLLLVPHFGIRSDVSNILGTTKIKVDAWLSEVRKLKSRGRGLDDIVKEFVLRITKETGMKQSDFPVYASVLTRVTIMGIIKYLEKNP